MDFAQQFLQHVLGYRTDTFFDGEDDVIEYELIINEFALLRNQWLGITKALDQKSYALSNIIRLRCAGMEDATL